MPCLLNEPLEWDISLLPGGRGGGKNQHSAFCLGGFGVFPPLSLLYPHNQRAETWASWNQERGGGRGSRTDKMDLKKSSKIFPSSWRNAKLRAWAEAPLQRPKALPLTLALVSYVRFQYSMNIYTVCTLISSCSLVRTCIGRAPTVAGSIRNGSVFLTYST